MKLFYSDAYVAPAHSFETTRKAQWIADSLSVQPIAGVELVEPRPLTVAEFETVHSPAYVHAVRTGTPRHLAESQGFTWDPGIWKMACATNGGAVAAALAALRDGVAGSLSAGLHHARYDSGMGFCTFNGLALAAFAALKAGARDVLILDLDAHCGGGTLGLIFDNPHIWQWDVSTCSFDGYATSASRHYMKVVRESRRYLKTIREILASGPHFDLCLYNAGMDPNGTISKATLAKREQLVFQWARETKTPIAFVLAGGYLSGGLDESGLVGLHRLTIEAAVSSGEKS